MSARALRTEEERRAFVAEHSELAPVPLVPEIRLYRAQAVGPVWFETARWLDDDDADVPFWCVPWAGGQALARYVLDQPDLVRGARVLDFACGRGSSRSRRPRRAHACTRSTWTLSRGRRRR